MSAENTPEGAEGGTLANNNKGVAIQPAVAARHGEEDVDAKETKQGQDQGNEISHASSSSSSNSRLSIRIPRKAMSEEADEGGIASGTVSKRDSLEGSEPIDGGNADKTASDGETASEASSHGGRKKKKASDKRPVRGRRRRGDDSEESAYSESDVEEVEETSESEEVYSGEESEESEEEYEDEEDTEEEWDERTRKYVKRTTARPSVGPTHFRNTMPPMTIPFHYGAYAPIAPLPPSMANIPMFARMAAQSTAVAGVPAPSTTAGATGAVPTVEGTDSASPASTVSSTIAGANVPFAPTTAATAAVGGGTTSAAPTAGLTPAQLQELTKSTIASLATAPPTGKLLLPRNPEAAIRPSPELKETLTSMLASPQWRQALLAKLQMNRTISAEQASKLGLRPATAPALPPMGLTPLPLYNMRPPMPITSYNYAAAMAPRPRGPKPGSKRKKKLRRSDSGEDEDENGGEDVPIASRRIRRSDRKTVDYSQFFKEEPEEDEDEDSIERPARPRLPTADGPTASGKRRGRPRKHINENVSEGEEAEPASHRGTSDDSEGEEYGMGSSHVSDDVGVEKILSHRVNSDGAGEFYVKFHNLSYVHCEWISEEEMLGESNGASRIKRFLSKPLSMRHYSDKHIFNPEYTQIERIIHGWEHPDETDNSVMTASYLIKWAGLPYDEATWEKKTTILSLPDGPYRLREFEGRLTLAQRQSTSTPGGYRPDRSTYVTMTESPIYKGDNILRLYQLEGVNWLVYCWINRQSCIIADEMGLGKTVQSVAFLNLIYTRYNIRGPFLVIAPLSTIPHWEREFEAWTDLNCIVYHGNIPSRDLMAEYEFYYKDKNDRPIPGYCKFDVLITTYEMALAGFEHLQSIQWRAAVFDEAHRLKNRASKASETLKSLQIEHKVLLTGTPLQNNIEELWSLLNFLQPHRFFSESQFVAEYGNLKKSEDVIRLQEMLKPLMLRRLKEDVEKSIPVKEETVIEVELTAVQKRYYRAILERNFAFLTKGCVGTNAPNLINAMMELRKCCIHPYLIKGAEERIVTECSAQTADEQMQCMIQASGKLVLVDKLLRRLREDGHRVLIFSQMTRCLDLLVDYLRWRGYPYERIDGAIRGDLRQAAIDRFCDPASDSFVFLLCTRAGGVGINLTAADTVVIFDSDWNPQNDIQAQARCHRIGQTKSVKVYRLLTRNTYEREMFDKAGMKLGLDRAVLRKILPSETLEGASHNPQLSKKEVETLLKKGAYGLLMENDEDAIKFCEEDIDQILARRTTVIRHEGGAQEAAAEGGSIFSKASFAATADDMDIDIDDPNFWELWARRLDLDPRQLLSSSGVVVDEPRIKRQARRLRQEDLNLPELESMLEEVGREYSVGPTGGRWNDAERAAFILALLRKGIHRFEELTPQFPGRSKNDLIACARALIKACLETVEGGDDVRLREDNEKLLLAHLDFDRSTGESVDESTGKIDLVAAEMEVAVGAEDADNQEETNGVEQEKFSKADIPYGGASKRQIREYRSFWREAPEKLVRAVQEVGKPILLRLQLLEFIRQLVEGHATVAKKSGATGATAAGGRKKQPTPDSVEYHLPVPQIIGAAPARGWGKSEDETLVIGIYRHGWGAYETIKADPTLSFASTTWKVVVEEEAATRSGEGMDDAINSTTTLQDPEWPTSETLDERLVKVVLAMEKRTQAAAKLAIQAINAGEGGRRRSTVTAKLSGPGRRDDDFRDDDEMYQEEEEFAPDGRRRSVGKALIKTRRGRAATVVEDEDRRQVGLSTRWSKRDRGEFQRVILAYGLPPERSPGKRDWSKFRELGSFANTILRAGDRPFDEYCAVFVKACRAATEKRTRRKRDEKTGELIDPEQEEEGEEDENPSSDYDGETDDAVPTIPLERAKRALARIEMFERLRERVLTIEDLSVHLERSRKTSGLPSWWETPLHDVALLEAVGKHGLGRWDLVLMDETLPFREMYRDAHPEAFEGVLDGGRGQVGASAEEPPAKRGRRRKPVTSQGTPAGIKVDPSRIDWPQETTLSRRIESLMEMASRSHERALAAAAAAAKAEEGVAKRENDKTTSVASPRKRVRLTHASGKGRRTRQKSLLEFSNMEDATALAPVEKANEGK